MRLRSWTILALLFMTSTPSFTACGDFTVSTNLLQLPGSVTMEADVNCLSSESVVRVYNDAREQVKNLPFPMPLAAPPAVGTVTWDGKNQSGEDCASGVYILHLTGSPVAGWRRVVVVR
jgi:hypothetical protein